MEWDSQFTKIKMLTEEDKNKESLISQQGLPKQENESSTNNIQSNQSQLTPLEQLIDKVGGQHTYQFKTAMIFNLMWFLTSWMLVGQGFFFDARYQCFNYNDKDQCSNYICNTLKPQERLAGMKWHANSIIFAFENQLLICQKQYLQPILTSLIYAGSLIGFFVIPYVADNWGRKIGIQISWGFFIIGLVFYAVADSSHMIGMGQLMVGFGCNPAITLCYSFLNQQVLREKRQNYGVMIQVFLAIGQCTIAFMFLPDYSWKVVVFILLGLVIFNQILMMYLVESPKFLISKSKKKTFEVLNQIAQKNKRPKLQFKQMQSIQSIGDQQAQGTSIIDLFKYKSLFWATISGGLVFLAIQVIYYGTLLNFDQIGFSKLLNQEMVGVSQGIGYIAAQIIISKITRKKWSMIGMGLSAVLCFVLALTTSLKNDNNEQLLKIVQTIFLILNRFVLCAFWGLFYVYIAQMYPTKVRSMGFGWTSAMGTVGSTLSPYIIYGSNQLGVNSWIVPGIFGAIGFISIFKLKQTYKKPLYDDIQEVRLKGRWELSDDQGQTQETQRKNKQERQKSIDLQIQ